MLLENGHTPSMVKVYLGFENLNKSVSGVGLLGATFLEEKPLVLTIKIFDKI